MSKRNKYLAAFLLLMFVSFSVMIGCGSGARQIGEASDFTYPIDPAHIKGNLMFLAGDALEGREATTRGEKLAAAYISTELQKYGVSPFGDDSSTYMERVDLKLLKFDSNSAVSLVGENGETLTVFRGDSDFVGSTRYFSEIDTTCGLIFAGFGITAEEYNYDDYRDLDVSGKIVLILHGEPVNDDTTFFAGKNRTKYSSWTQKMQRAKDSGAVGVMMPSWSEKRYGWQSAVDYVNKGTLSLLDDSSNTGRRRLPMISLRERTLEALFSYAPYSYTELNRMIDEGSDLPKFEFANSVSVLWKFSPADTVQAWNVLGIVPGNDPELRHEYIVLGAHYDHIGSGPAGIYNGADDNASGTVGVMEIAKAFGCNRDNARSVVFAFHTGEEKGLLGSKFLVKNYPYKKEIMAHINLDMIGRGSVDSIYSVGSDRISSELRDIVENVNKHTVGLNFNYHFDDPNDPERIYYRSDHYSYAKEGIPSVFFYDNMQEDYHKPTDTADKINITKIAKLVELCYQTILQLANLPHRLEADRLATEK